MRIKQQRNEAEEREREIILSWTVDCVFAQFLLLSCGCRTRALFTLAYHYITIYYIYLSMLKVNMPVSSVCVPRHAHRTAFPRSHLIPIHEPNESIACHTPTHARSDRGTWTDLSQSYRTWIMSRARLRSQYIAFVRECASAPADVANVPSRQLRYITLMWFSINWTRPYHILWYSLFMHVARMFVCMHMWMCVQCMCVQDQRQ